MPKPPVGLEPTTSGLQNRCTPSATDATVNTCEKAENPLSPRLLVAQREPAPVDPELAELASVWNDLPADVRKMILGVVRLTPKAAMK